MSLIVKIQKYVIFPYFILAEIMVLTYVHFQRNKNKRRCFYYLNNFFKKILVEKGDNKIISSKIDNYLSKYQRIREISVNIHSFIHINSFI